MQQLEPAIDRGDYVRAFEGVREQVEALTAEHRDRLPMWTIYGPGTTDQPGLYVARLFLTYPDVVPTEALMRAATLGEVREMLPAGLVCLPRQAADDRNIIETWF